MRKLMLSMFGLAIVHTMACVAAGSAQTPGPAIAPGSAVATGDVRVGHTVKQIIVPGSLSGEERLVDVHVWYPADSVGFADAPKTFYTSRLYGEPLIAARWDPLAWRIEARIAREQTAIDPAGRAFPVIVFSHGATNDPIDYAYTLELIAAAGFVVAAPAHVNNTQDDVRTDYVNGLAGALGPVLSCRDGQTTCVGMNVPRSMRDRVRDISSVLAALPGWYGDRVDVSRAGLMGHSRGTVTALVAAGGSVAAGTVPEGATIGCGTKWEIPPLPGIKAVMGLAIGAPPITYCTNFANVTVPVLLVAGELDGNSLPEISQVAFDRIGSTKKTFLVLDDAVHRSFDSTYCAQMQAAGAIAQANPRALLEKHTVDLTVKPSQSGVAMNFCTLASFTDPVDIRPLVTSITGFNFATQPVAAEGFDTEAVKRQVTEAAVAFFSEALDPTPPVITYSILGTLGTAGWYRSDVAVNWTVTDPESDLTSSTGCGPTSVTADTEGDAFTCTASSAGGSSILQTVLIKRDATKPTITYDGNAGSYSVTDTVSITCSAEDNLSGVASSTCAARVSAAAYNFEAGANTLTDSATDFAGNVGPGSVTFTLEVAPAALCALTHQFVSSTAYERLTPARKAAAQALAAITCGWLSKIIPRLTPSEKAHAVSVYRRHVEALARAGWLTASQAKTLTRLADAL